VKYSERHIVEEFVIGYIVGLVVSVHLEVRGPPPALTLGGIGVEYWEGQIAEEFLIGYIADLVVSVHVEV